MFNNYDIRKALLENTKNNPEKKAIIYGDQTISYSELWNAIICLSYILKQVGVKKSSFVAVYMSNSIDMVVALFTILNLNAVVVPINVDLPDDRIIDILSESSTGVLLYNKHMYPKTIINNTVGICVDYMKLNLDKKKLDGLFSYEPKDLAYCIFTSGSSGKPKGVLLTYEGILNHIKAKVSLLKMTSESRLCLSFNIGFVASIWQIITPILLGAQLYIYNNDLIKMPYQFLRQLEKDRINIVSMIPQSLYTYCNYIGEKHQKLTLQDLSHIVLTGEKLDKIVVTNFYRLYDHISLINAYGQSECSDDTFHYEIPLDNIPDEIPIGKPIQNISFHILDENMNKVVKGEKGELYISGACLAQRYLNNKQLTRDKFVNIYDAVYFRTGDIVKLNENDVVYISRADNQIKINAHLIEVEEVESYINQIEGIKQSAVFVIETSQTDKILAAYYTSDMHISSKNITNHLSTKLPPYMIPSVLKRVDKFYLNSNGKIDRKKIRECVEIKPENNLKNTSAPDGLNGLRKRSFNVIVENLSEKVIENLSLDSDLKSIGIDSITFIKIIVALEREFNFDFDDEKLLITAFSTVKTIIEYVESKVSL